MARSTPKTSKAKKNEKNEAAPLTESTKRATNTPTETSTRSSAKKPFSISSKAAAKKSAATKNQPSSAPAAAKAPAVTKEKRTELKPTKKTSTTTENHNSGTGADAAKKPAAGTAKPSNKAEVARKLLQSKAAAKKGAVSKPKPSRPIAFTLDEAIEVAKTKTETAERSANGSAATKPAARDNQKKEVPGDMKQESRVLGAASISDILGYNPNAGPKKEDASDVPPKFARYYELLLELRQHVVSGLDTHTRETLKRSAKEDSGDLSAYSQHMADAGTETFDRDFALSLVSSEQDALFEIEDAIRRIKKGTYGICEITGKPIKKERLLAVPFAKYSVEGQVEFERTNRKSAYRGGAFGDTSDDSVQFMDDDSDE